MSGMRTVAIPYEIPLNELGALLPMLNGFYLPGGSVHLVNKTTKSLHPYYVRTKMILDYSMKMKDELNEEWPVVGFC